MTLRLLNDPPLFTPEVCPRSDTPAARLLIVDDDTVTCALLTHYLTHEGYGVQAVQSGPDALAMLDTYAPDIICLDYVMPGMDGQEVARQIRARQDVIYVPIIMLSGTRQPQDVKWDSLKSGVDVFLAKPVVPAELDITVRTMLRMKKAQDFLVTLLGMPEGASAPAGADGIPHSGAVPPEAPTRTDQPNIGPALESMRQALTDLNRAFSLSPHMPLDRASQGVTLARLNAAATHLAALMTHISL